MTKSQMGEIHFGGHDHENVLRSPLKVSDDNKVLSPFQIVCDWNHSMLL